MSNKSKKQKVLKLLLFILGFIFLVLILYKLLNRSSEISILDVVLTVDAPFSHSAITITEGGDIYYVAKDLSNGGLDTQKSKSISKKQFKDLESLIMIGNFFELEEGPQVDTNLMDLSTYTITVRTIPSDPNLRPLAYPGVMQVKCYEENCHPLFMQIKEKIIELWGEKVLEVGV